MQEKPTADRASQRKAWDANYRDKNRERRREYDRARMRRIRGEGSGS
jgi:hypothetical protein